MIELHVISYNRDIYFDLLLLLMQLDHLIYLFIIVHRKECTTIDDTVHKPLSVGRSPLKSVKHLRYGGGSYEYDSEEGLTQEGQQESCLTCATLVFIREGADEEERLKRFHHKLVRSNKAKDNTERFALLPSFLILHFLGRLLRRNAMAKLPSE